MSKYKVNILYYFFFIINFTIIAYSLKKFYSNYSINGKASYLLFCILFLLFFILSLVFYNSSKYKKNYILSVFSISLLLLFIEIIFSIKPINDTLLKFKYFFFKTGEEITLEKEEAKKNIILQYNPKYDFRTNDQYYKDEIKLGRNLLPRFSPTLLIDYNKFDGIEINENNFIHPLSKISNKLTILCKEIDTWKTYITDNYGFNNPNINSYENLDYILLGGSTVEGHCLEHTDTLASQLSSELKKKIVNFGIWDGGPITRLGQIIEYVTIFKPKVVIWFHSSNDISTLKSKEILSQSLMKYLNENNFKQNLFNRQSDINNAIVKFNKNFEFINKIDHKKNALENDKILNLNLVNFIKLQNTRKFFINDYYLNHILKNFKHKLMPSKADMEFFKLYEKVILKAKSIINGYGGKIIFIYLPDISTIYPHIGETNIKLEREKTIKIWKKNNFSFIDISKKMKKTDYKPEDLFVYGIWGNHYTKLGNQIVVNEIYNSKLIN